MKYKWKRKGYIDANKSITLFGVAHSSFIALSADHLCISRTSHDQESHYLSHMTTQHPHPLLFSFFLAFSPR